MERLRRRADFLRAAKGRKWTTPSLMLQMVARGEDGEPRIGFTASKRIGGAVERNRARRRLREAAREILPQRARRGHDYVIVARRECLTRPYDGLKKDLALALDKLHRMDRRGARNGRTAGSAGGNHESDRDGKQ